MNNIGQNVLNTVPISVFNRGMASKIFDDVKQNGIKIVLKNNEPECILMSLAEYAKIQEDKKRLHDLAAIHLMEDLRIAEEECKQYGAVSEEELCKEFGITL